MTSHQAKRLIWPLLLAAIAIAIATAALIYKHYFRPCSARAAGPTFEPARTTKTNSLKPNSRPTQNILRSQLAGQWYPADATTLNGQLTRFFQQAKATPKPNVIALILPHAGYAFSGPTAAEGLKTAAGPYHRIVVIGPSHRFPLDQTLSVPDVTHYQSPLATTPLDRPFIQKLLNNPIFQTVPYVHAYEHSVQIHLPLLQHKFKNFRLVPIVVGSCSLQTIHNAARTIKSLLDDKTLVIASSDFTHYGPNYDFVPFTKDIPAQIKKLDMGAYEHIASLEPESFLQYRYKTGATICGYIPIAILLAMLDKDTKAQLVHYTTSGEVTGDYTNSVSYLAVSFTGRWRPVTAPQPPTQTLSEDDKQLLLRLARSAIKYYLDNKTIPTAQALELELTEQVTVPRAAFVTLKKHGRLRGCIGDIFPRQPLYKSVLSNALNAAFRNSRFQPLGRDELPEITIEISVLTAPKPVDSYTDIRLGTDGIILRKGYRSAVFLPQVAPEQGWNLSQTLTHLAVKAGLPPEAWKQGASFLVFQADVFGEEK